MSRQEHHETTMIELVIWMRRHILVVRQVQEIVPRSRNWKSTRSVNQLRHDQTTNEKEFNSTD